MADNPRVLFVGRSRYRLPLPGWLAKKWDAIEEVLDYRVLGSAERRLGAEQRALPALPRPRARARSTGCSSTCGSRAGSGARSTSFEPDAIVAADPFVGAAALLGRRRARLARRR